MSAKKKRFIITIEEKDLPKIRKPYAPLTQVVKDATKYNRKQKHKKAHEDTPLGFFTILAQSMFRLTHCNFQKAKIL